MNKEGEWLLALDLSTPRGILVLEGPGGIYSAEIPGDSRVSRLFSAAAELGSNAGINPGDLGLIGVGRGPGSFTGIKVAVMAAKFLATVLDVPLVAPDSLMVTAAGVHGAGETIFAALDARRGEIYYGIYRVGDGYPVALEGPSLSRPETAAVSLRKWRERSAGEVVAAGRGIGAYAHVWPEGLQEVGVEVPSPEGLAWLCRLAYRRGEKVDPMLLLPLYLRRPDAQERWGCGKGDRA